MGSKRRNLSLIYLFCFFRMFLIFIPVLVPFFQDKNLSMKDIFLLQAVFGLVVAIFEVPSGYLCDFFGRKKTLMLGTFLSGLSFTWLYFSESFLDFLIFESLVGMGMSFISGADFSLLYDSFPNTKQAATLQAKAVAQIYFSLGVAESIASIIGGLLVLISFKAVLAAQLIAGWIPFFITFFLIEPERKKPEKNHGENMKQILFEIFKKDKQTTLIFFNQVGWGLSSFIAVWIFQKYWLEENIPLYAFGILWALYNLTVAIMGKRVLDIQKRLGRSNFLNLMGILPILGYLGLYFLSGWAGVVIGLCFQVSRAFNQVFLKDQLNKKFDSQFRATLNSMTSLFFRGGFFIIGPAVGYSIDSFGMNRTFLILAAVFSAAWIFLLQPLRRTFNMNI